MKGAEMPKDTDGTNWATVTFTFNIDVMAETEAEAIYFATLKMQDTLPEAVDVAGVEL